MSAESLRPSFLERLTQKWVAKEWSTRYPEFMQKLHPELCPRRTEYTEKWKEEMEKEKYDDDGKIETVEWREAWKESQRYMVKRKKQKRSMEWGREVCYYLLRSLRRSPPGPIVTLASLTGDKPKDGDDDDGDDDDDDDNNKNKEKIRLLLRQEIIVHSPFYFCSSSFSSTTTTTTGTSSSSWLCFVVSMFQVIRPLPRGGRTLRSNIQWHIVLRASEHFDTWAAEARDQLLGVCNVPGVCTSRSFLHTSLPLGAFRRDCAPVWRRLVALFCDANKPIHNSPTRELSRIVDNETVLLSFVFRCPGLFRAWPSPTVNVTLDEILSPLLYTTRLNVTRESTLMSSSFSPFSITTLPTLPSLSSYSLPPPLPPPCDLVATITSTIPTVSTRQVTKAQLFFEDPGKIGAIWILCPWVNVPAMTRAMVRIVRNITHQYKVWSDSGKRWIHPVDSYLDRYHALSRAMLTYTFRRFREWCVFHEDTIRLEKWVTLSNRMSSRVCTACLNCVSTTLERRHGFVYERVYNDGRVSLRTKRESMQFSLRNDRLDIQRDEALSWRWHVQWVLPYKPWRRFYTHTKRSSGDKKEDKSEEVLLLHRYCLAQLAREEATREKKEKKKDNGPSVANEKEKKKLYTEPHAYRAGYFDEGYFAYNPSNDDPKDVYHTWRRTAELWLWLSFPSHTEEVEVGEEEWRLVEERDDDYVRDDVVVDGETDMKRSDEDLKNVYSESVGGYTITLKRERVRQVEIRFTLSVDWCVERMGDPYQPILSTLLAKLVRVRPPVWSFLRPYFQL